MNGICEALERGFGSLFECSHEAGIERVRTPFRYPDGGSIDLFWTPYTADGSGRLSDLGETLNWLALSSTSTSRSRSQNDIIEWICRTRQVVLRAECLEKEVRGATHLAAAVLQLSQAALAVSDLHYTLRATVPRQIVDSVAEYLEEHRVVVERRPMLKGISGRVWTVDLRTLGRAPEQADRPESLVSILSPRSRSALSSSVNRAVTTWLDLGGKHKSVANFVSLIDDEAESKVWKQEDVRLLEEVSVVASWSQREDFLELVA